MRLLERDRHHFLGVGDQSNEELVLASIPSDDRFGLMWAAVLEEQPRSGIVELMSRQTHNLTLLQRFIDGGISVEAIEKSPWTLLHRALSDANPAAVSLFLRTDLDPSRRTADGKTTLKVLLNRRPAYSKEHVDGVIECVRLLLEAGADPLRVGYSKPASYEFVRDSELPESAVDAIEEMMRPFAGGYLPAQIPK